MISNRNLLAAALSAALFVPVTANAADIVWDGTAGDGFWTNGPQDEVNNPGNFPANGTQGGNWTIDAGTPGQVVVPTTGPGQNLIDYGFDGHDWTISSATISEDTQVKLDGGTLNITDSTVSLLPSSLNTTAALSGLNLGQNGNPTVGTLTNSTLNANRSNQNGNSLRLFNGSSLAVVNSTINVTSEIEFGNLTLENTDSTMTVDSTSTLNISGTLQVSANSQLTLNGGTIVADNIRLNSGPNPTEEDPVTEYSEQFVFNGGDITLSSANPFRDNSAFEGAFNWTAPADDGSIITHTDLTDADERTLAYKVFQGFFSIDGERVNPELNDPRPTLGGAATIADLNAELATLAVNGKALFLTDDTLEQTLTLISVPTFDPADLDQDGDVDDADFGIAFAAFTGPNNGPSSNPAADLDSDGDVDDADFGIAFAAFTGPGGAAAVPEPTSLALLGLGGLLIARRRRA